MTLFNVPQVVESFLQEVAKYTINPQMWSI